jgi:hypothetical protein
MFNKLVVLFECLVSNVSLTINTFIAFHLKLSQFTIELKNKKRVLSSTKKIRFELKNEKRKDFCVLKRGRQ